MPLTLTFAPTGPIPVRQSCDGELALEGQVLARAELVETYQRGSP